MDDVVELPAAVTSPALARRFVMERCAASGDAALAEVVVLLVSELVTNAVLHARTASVLRLHRGDGRLRVELHDASTEPAVARPAGQNGQRTGGRGVLLVESLADRWGSDVGEHGKTVWFEVVVHGSAIRPATEASGQ